MFRQISISTASFTSTGIAPDWTFAPKAVLRSIDTDGRAPRMFERAALKRRHVSFSTAGHECDGGNARIMAELNP